MENVFGAERNRVGQILWLLQKALQPEMFSFGCKREPENNQRFQRAGSMKKGLLALDNPKAERLHTKNPSRCARGFFVFRRLIGPSAAAAAAPRRGADLRLMLALSAARQPQADSSNMPFTVTTFSGENVNRKNPQIFSIYEIKILFPLFMPRATRRAF